MAKDPAFLFYPNDYIGGTMGMSFAEKGAYIEVLMMQFNQGHMTSHMIGQVIGQLWDNIKHKFMKDDNELWYNERLDIEQNKRKSFSNSRRNNLKGNNQYSKVTTNKRSYDLSMTPHMENENEDENRNRNRKGGMEEKQNNNRFTKPTILEIAEYIKEKKYSVDPDKFYNYYESNGWKVGKNPMKNWKAALSGTWQARDGTKVLVQKFGKQAVDNMDALKRFNEKMELKQINAKS